LLPELSSVTISGSVAVSPMGFDNRSDPPW
jgi:hypothetical protein